MTPLPDGLVAEAAVLAVVSAVGLGALWLLRRRPPPARLQPAPAPRESQAVKAMGDLLEEVRRTNQWMTENLDRRVAELKILLAEADRRADEMAQRARRAEPSMPPPAAPAGLPNPTDEVGPELRAVFETVYAKADHGKPLTDIARETGLNKGAVNLILGLRQAQRSPDGPVPPLPPR